MKKPWVLSYPLSAQRRLWSDWADAQADLSLCWAHTHFVGFVMMQLIWKIVAWLSSSTQHICLSSAVALWTSWKILQALKRRSKTFRLRGLQERQIHIVNTAEDWERFSPMLNKSCEKIKVSLFSLLIIKLQVCNTVTVVTLLIHKT